MSAVGSHPWISVSTLMWLAKEKPQSPVAWRTLSASSDTGSLSLSLVRSAAATSGGTHVGGQLVERAARRQRQYGVQNDGDPELTGLAIKTRRMRYRRDTGTALRLTPRDTSSRGPTYCCPIP